MVHTISLKKSSYRITLMQEQAMKLRIDYDPSIEDCSCSKLCPEIFEYNDDQMPGRIAVSKLRSNKKSGKLARKQLICRPFPHW